MLQIQTIEYRDADALLEGFLAYDETLPKPLPAVLISHAWAGRDEFVCDKARKLAELGYAGFALDMYGKGILGSGREQNARLMKPFMDDRASLQNRITAALEALRRHRAIDPDRIAAMGFCFGGLCVLDLARTGADVRGVISFHGLLSAPGNTHGNTIKAKVLVLHGHDDPLAPFTQVTALAQELSEAGADWQIHLYGNTLHAFTNPKADDPGFGTVYNDASDRRSWQSMQNFLAEVLG